MRYTSKGLELINTYSLKNVGDAAIYASLSAMSNTYGINDVSAPGLAEDDATLFKQLGVKANLKTNINATKQSENKALPCLSVGGDIFNNARPAFITRQFVRNLRELNKQPKQTALFGQSIPRSCHGLSFYLLTKQLKKLSNIVVRDQESFDRLQQAGVMAKLSYDCVFAAPVNTNHHNLIRGYYQDTFRELALISLRSFDHLYPHDNAQFQYQLSELISRLHKEGYRVGIILQSHVDNADSDLSVIRHLQNTQNIEVIDPFAVHEKFPNIAPWQIAQAFIAQAELVIGVRYHTAIFRLLAGKMAFNIYYSNKGEDLSQRLNVPGCSVAEFSVDKYFNQILATQHQSFSAQVIADQVSNDFKQLIQRLNQQNSNHFFG